MPFAKKTWVAGRAGGTPFNAVDMNRIEDGIGDLYTVSYAEDMTEVQTTGTGSFGDPTSGTVGPLVTVTVPAGGRFVDLAAECEAHHSANNTNGIWFVLMFSQDGGAFGPAPSGFYTTQWAYNDTNAGAQLTYGAAVDLADATYRPVRLGQGKTPNGGGTGALDRPSHTRIWLPAGSWRVKMGYGIKAGGSGTAYFKTRRLRAQVLPN